MIQRELALTEIANRIRTNAASLGLVSFKRSPLSPITEEKTPFTCLYEGVDTIKNYTSRSNNGYPAKRKLEVIIEITTDNTFDIRKLYRDMRSVVLLPIPPASDTVLYEESGEGPFGYGVPKLLGMRLILALIYIDKGI